jgi:hypothetical protein
MNGQNATASMLMEPEIEVVLSHRTLVIGNVKRWEAAGKQVTAFEQFQFSDLSALNKETLSEFDPEIILSPLVGDDFDAVVVAEKLNALSFDGRYRAISFDTPNVAIIRDDVSQAAPHLDFDILQMKPLGRAQVSNQP